MATDANEKWFAEFFQGMALDLWRRAIPIERTEQELAFLHEKLEAPAGGKLLDVPCGDGRLCLPLSLMGYKVTGVDFCQPFIELANQAAKAHKTKIEYVQGDMRELDRKAQFDGAFCMGNSFGYFDRAGTIEFLQAVSNSLKSGARFVLDSAMIAECFLANGGEREWVKLGDMLMLIDNHYNCRNSSVDSVYTFIQGGKQESRTATHFIYTCGDLCQMLEKVGFSIVELLGGSNLEDPEPFAIGADRLVVVAVKN